MTQDRNLARVFSYKPANVSISVHVSISDEGFKHVTEVIKHDGEIPGFLYQIAEEVKPEDIYPHPHSSMEEGKEWLTTRELRVKLIGVTQIVEEEKLAEKEIAKLRHLQIEKERRSQEKSKEHE